MKIWAYGGQFGPKNHFFREIFTFLAGAHTGRAPSTGEITYAFSARGLKMSKKSRKNHEKVEIFRFFKVDPNVIIWTYGGQFWPKN